MEEAREVVAIIVAAGSGLRMQSDHERRKQYITLMGKPVVAHCISIFDRCDVVEEIFLVIPQGDEGFCQREVLAPLRLKKPVHVVTGGASRQESVFNGLRAINGRCHLVAIHDGVRPLVTPEEVSRCVMTAREYGACVLGVPATDTIKTVDKDDRVVETMDRQMVRTVQTPQVFHYHGILEAHLAARQKQYVGTDDAELLEKNGGVVKVIPGARTNIKITTAEDLRLAEALLSCRAERNVTLRKNRVVETAG